jgi:hypothetical protein
MSRKNGDSFKKQKVNDTHSPFVDASPRGFEPLLPG